MDKFRSFIFVVLVILWCDKSFLVGPNCFKVLPILISHLCTAVFRFQVIICVRHWRKKLSLNFISNAFVKRKIYLKAFRTLLVPAFHYVQLVLANKLSSHMNYPSIWKGNTCLVRTRRESEANLNLDIVYWLGQQNYYW